MGLIYYRGEEYTEMPPILANAITLTEEEAERYNISLVDADVQEVTLNTGERLFLGTPGSNFVALGMNIVQAATDEEFIAKIKPEDAYTSFIPPTGCLNGNWICNGDSDYSQLDNFNITFTKSGSNVTLTSGGGRKNELTLSASDLYAYGYIFRATNIHPDKLYCRGYLVTWTKNQNGEYEVTNAVYNSNSNNREALWLFNHWNEGEYDYACGITGKFSYVTKEEWDEIVAGQGD